MELDLIFFFFSSRRRHTRLQGDWSSDVCSSDLDRIGNTHYFAMEFVEGTDLGKVVQLSGPLPVAEACDYIRQVASGLQYAQTMGLVHRDIKPANLFLITPPGHDTPAPGTTWKRPADPVIKILDWGLARLQGVAEGPDSVSAGTEE